MIYEKASNPDKKYCEAPGNVHCGSNEAQKTNDYGAELDSRSPE